MVGAFDVNRLKIVFCPEALETGSSAARDVNAKILNAKEF